MNGAFTARGNARAYSDRDGRMWKGEELRQIVVRRGYKITSAATLQFPAAAVVH